MEAFKIKNGLQAGRYLGTNGVETSGVGDPYDLLSASYDSVSFSVAAQDIQPFGLTFNNDGTKMYLTGYANKRVFQYSLSTAFDLSTASYDNVSFLLSGQDAQVYDVIFKPDGTKMYMLGSATDSVFQYSLSTAFDVSTASYDSVSFDVISEDINPTSITFSNDGTKLYIVSANLDTVRQYSLSTAFDVSTASYDSISYALGPQPTAMNFNNDGTKMYVTDRTTDTVDQHSLSTAFDLSTASYDNVSFSVASQDVYPVDVIFNTGGTKMYVLGYDTDTIYQYSTRGYTETLDLSTGTTFSFTPSGATTVSFTNPPASGNAIGFSVEVIGDGSAITWPDSIKWSGGTAPVASVSKELYTLVTTDGGTTYYGKKAAEGVA